MKTPLETLRHHVTGAIQRGEAEAITEIPAVPAPVWRLLEPGEIIREGDELYDGRDANWKKVARLGVRCPSLAVIRRRIRLRLAIPLPLPHRLP